MSGALGLWLLRLNYLLFYLLIGLLMLRFRGLSPRQRRWWRRGLLVAAFGFAASMFFRTAWVSEDAYILFRSLEQLMAGRGPVWNPNERVQVFTSPLWYWILALIRWFSNDVFLNAILVHAVLYSLLLAFAWFTLSPWAFGLTLLVFWASNGFADYVTSGLEMALGFLLLWVWVWLIQRLHQENSPSPKQFQAFWSITFLILLARLDWSLLVLPGFFWSLKQAGKSFSWRWILPNLFLTSSPLWTWLTFALVFYGSPLPNTFYAKLTSGIPRVYWLRQGFLYYFGATWWIDPITLFVPVAAMVGGFFRARRAPWWASGALGLMLFLGYVGYIGGDFMLSRFFAAPYVMAWALLVYGTPPISRPPGWNVLRMGAVVGGLTVYHLLFIPTPLNTSHTVQPMLTGCGIEFERNIYFSSTSLRAYLRYRLGRPSKYPGEWAQEGLAFRESGQRVTVRGAVGKFGYYAGTEVIIIDDLALGDAFLARLPAVNTRQRVGHIHRPVPEGYVESHLSGRPQLEDPQLNTLLEHVFLLTRGPLWSQERWQAILFLLLGGEKKLTAHLNLPEPTGPPAWQHEPVWACTTSLRPSPLYGSIVWFFPWK